MLKMLKSSFFILTSFTILSQCQHDSSQCKFVPGDAGWPSTQTWNALNVTLGGRLLKPVPPGAVCHPDQPSYNPTECPKVAAEWGLYDYHASNPISVMSSQYVNDTCLPDPSYSCSSAGYPVYVVNATTPQHVKLAIAFAQKNNIRLVVKSTGHDFMGRSTAPNSLSIWTHHMNTIESHGNMFRPQGCEVISGTAVTLGAGVQMEDAFAHLGSLNQTMIGASARSVSISGYVTGGGFSLLSPRYGLAADNVLEMEVVTPAGDILTINECQNADMFWAMRGGGGSTFAVITSVTVRTHPSPGMLAMDFMILADANEPFIYDMAAFIFSQLPDMGSKGMSGYASVITSMPNPIPTPDAPKEVAGVIGLATLQDTSDEEDMIKIWKPINDTLSSKWPGSVQFIPRVTAYGSYLDWISVYYDNRTTGGDFYMASRLLDIHALAGNSSALAQAIKAAAERTDGLTAFLVSGKGVHSAGGNAVNPGWRKSYVHAVTSKAFVPLNATAKAETIETLNAVLEPFRKLSPDTGAYINEAFPYETDWQHTFWGDNYAKLLGIKFEVDPNDVLWCQNCVGSERWTENSGKLCRLRN